MGLDRHYLLAKRWFKMQNKTPRYLAVNLLESIEQQQRYANLSLNHLLQHERLSDVDKHLVTRLVYGTIQWQLRLDYNWRAFVKTPDNLPIWVQMLLRMSLYQLFFLDKVPAHAILNEANEIAKTRDHGRYVKLVNAVLRHVQRAGEQDYQQIANDVERLSITSSVPLWLTQRLVEQYGFERCKNMLAVVNQPPHASARVNTLKTNRDEMLAELATTFTDIKPSEVSPVGLTAAGGNFAQTTAFKNGELTIQDESSMLVAPSLQVEPQHQVLDACSAPGGKTTHIATYLDPEQGGSITALDIHQRKLKLVEDNAQRLGVDDRLTTLPLDARKVDQTFADETFDRILVDAPCSGLGLMRRKPEIRYAKQEQDIARLPEIQGDILAAAAAKLKVGGLMVYSTCTILAAENQEVVQNFLNNHTNFTLTKVKAAQDINWAGDQEMFQLLLDDYQTDGFFIACLKRIN